MSRPKICPKKRFWSKIKKDKNSNCWNWTAGKNKFGYGHISVNYKTTYAHRFSYELNVGPIGVGLHVLHKCDNPNCVNPDHLFLGTHDDNVQDKVNKNRQYRPQGELSPNSKLTSTQVLEIRQKRKTAGVSVKQLSSEYNIAEQTIRDVISYRRWAWLR